MAVVVAANQIINSVNPIIEETNESNISCFSISNSFI
jgi:hypothetical protein